MKKLCDSDYMSETLRHFDLVELTQWFDDLVRLDSQLAPSIAEKLPLFDENHGRMPIDYGRSIQSVPETLGIDYDVENLEAYHGYTVYGLPDHGRIRHQSGNEDLYYGIARATSYGATHKHHMSDAFNLILEGEGIFCGDPSELEQFRRPYHGKALKQGVQLEIPKGMTHGHLVKRGSDIWLFFVQVCGFRPNLRCADDFEIIDFDTTQFGDQYV